MNIMSYASYNNVTNVSAATENIRLFAESLGWTTRANHQGGWLQNVGFNGNPVHRTLLLEPPDTNRNVIYVFTTNGYQGTEEQANKAPYHLVFTSARNNDNAFMNWWNTTISNTSAFYTPPNAIFNNVNHHWTPECASTLLSILHLGPFPQQWVFGNDQWIHSVVQLDGQCIAHIGIGAPDLFNPAADNGILKYVTGYSSTTSYSSFCNHYWRTASDATNNVRYLDDSQRITDLLYPGSTKYIQYGTFFQDTLTSYSNSDYVAYNWMRSYKYTHATMPQGWSGRAMIFPVLLFGSVSGLATPVGYAPFGLMRHTNLGIGESIFYGNEEYLAFPMTNKNTLRPLYKIAYRIA